MKVNLKWVIYNSKEDNEFSTNNKVILCYKGNTYNRKKQQRNN